MQITVTSKELVLRAEESLLFWNTTTLNYNDEQKKVGLPIQNKVNEFSSDSGWYLFPLVGSLRLIAEDEEKIIPAYESTDNWVSYEDIIYDKPVIIQAIEDSRFILYKRAFPSNIPISQAKVTRVSSNSSINFSLGYDGFFYVVSNSTHSVIGASTSQVNPNADGRSDPEARFLVYPYKPNSIHGQITITTADPILVAQF